MGHALRGLRGCVGGVCLKRIDDAENLPCPGLGHRFEQLTGALVADCDLDARVHVARVEALFQVEHARGRGGVALSNRPLDGGGTAPARQVGKV